MAVTRADSGEFGTRFVLFRVSIVRAVLPNCKNQASLEFVTPGMILLERVPKLRQGMSAIA